MNKKFLSLAAWSARVLPNWAKRSIYRIGPLARFVRGELNRAAPVGLSTVTVAAGELQGMQLWLDLQTEKDYWLGTYEAELQATLRSLVKPGMVAYDVGANIGYISLMLARLAGEQGRVFAFEALPENVKRVQANLQLNNLDGRVTVVAVAVVGESGPVHFLVGPSNGMGKAEGSAGRQEITYAETITVEGISLDEFVFQKGNLPPQLIKIDIEGGEVLALPGMQRVLEEYHPLILMELHGPEAARAAWTVFQAAQYRVCRMQAGFPAVTGLEELDWKAYIVALSEHDPVPR
jgi:FkbM family methyltransferase